MAEYIRYAVKSGRIVSIEEVPSGLACGCICPSCNAKLVAKKGKVVIHHFAHTNGRVCSQFGETILHLIGKDILTKHRSITLPEVRCFDDHSREYVKLSAKQTVTYDSVELERRVDDLQPDAVLTFGKKELYVEIGVTHYVDEEKQSKIIARDKACIEIVLKELLFTDYTYSQVEDIVISSVSSKIWIHNPKRELLFRNFKIIQNKKIRQQQKYWESLKRQESRLKLLIREARKRKYDVVEVDEMGEFMCPKKMADQIKRIYGTWFSDQLKTKARWNGRVYGLGRNGRYMFINGEKVYIFPPDDDVYPTNPDQDISRKVYGQAMSFERRCKVDLITCQNCPYFQEEIGRDYEIVLCTFTRETT